MTSMSPVIVNLVSSGAGLIVFIAIEKKLPGRKPAEWRNPTCATSDQHDRPFR